MVKRVTAALLLSMVGQASSMKPLSLVAGVPPPPDKEKKSPDGFKVEKVKPAGELHKLMVCNAYASDEKISIISGLEEVGDNLLHKTKGWEKKNLLGGKGEVLAYKACQDVEYTTDESQKLSVFLGAENVGTFSVANKKLPDVDSKLLLVIKRRDESTLAAEFLSHVFAEDKDQAQLAILDTYQGDRKSEPSIFRDGKKDIIQALKFNAVTSVKPGKYETLLLREEKEEKVEKKDDKKKDKKEDKKAEKKDDKKKDKKEDKKGEKKDEKDDKKDKKDDKKGDKKEKKDDKKDEKKGDKKDEKKGDKKDEKKGDKKGDKKDEKKGDKKDDKKDEKKDDKKDEKKDDKKKDKKEDKKDEKKDDKKDEKKDDKKVEKKDDKKAEKKDDKKAEKKDDKKAEKKEDKKEEKKGSFLEASPELRGWSKKKEFNAIAGGTYVVLRVGFEEEGTEKFPEELVVYPTNPVVPTPPPKSSAIRPAGILFVLALAFCSLSF